MKVQDTDRPTFNKEEAAAEAVVMHCSDHRFQAAFHEFLTGSLKLRAYALLAIPGGGHFISMEEVMPKFFKVGLQNLSFLVKRTRARRAIIIGHDDCLFFKEKLQFYFRETEMNQKQVANLRRARKGLLEHFSGIIVELYFVDRDAQGSAHFLRIE